MDIVDSISFVIMASRKRKNCKFDEKLLILEEFDKKIPRSEICKYFNLAKSILSPILKDREKIYDALALGNCSPKTRRLRTVKFENIEFLLFEWHQKVRSLAVLISGDMLKEKALSIGQDFKNN